MPTETAQLPRPAKRLDGLQPYAVPRLDHPIKLWLGANEGCAPDRDLLALTDTALIDTVRRYPHADEFELALAERWRVSAKQVLLTAGIDDALLRSSLALLEPGRNMVLTTPTFEMFERYARIAGGELRSVAWWRGSYPIDEVLKLIDGSTSLIAFVSPNNPTGAAAAAEDLRRLSAAAPHAVVLADFAYAEYDDVDLSAIALHLPNVLLLRTFSKAWGLAGLRVGYAVGPRPVIDSLRSAGNPYAVSGLSLALAMSWFRTGAATVCQHVARVREEREHLSGLLIELGAAPLPSKANFVMARFDDADTVRAGLQQRGIFVRGFPGRPHLQDYLRITCPGVAVAFEQLKTALLEILSPAANRSYT